MKKSITPNQIRQNNINLIYQYIYQSGTTSQQDISYALHLSRPTVANGLNELEETGLIQKSGQLDSDYVGRKATAYSIVPDYKLSIGVEIIANQVKIVSVDLYEKYTKREVYEISYRNDEEYFKTVCKYITDFVDKIEYSFSPLTKSEKYDHILGVGIALQGLISPDGSTATYGKILDCTGLKIDNFSKHLPFSCTFIHDSTAAAVSELCVSPEINDAFYLLLSYHLGAAMIFNKSILSGKHGHNATIEHIVFKPGKKDCYCGKKGCAETLCSINALLKGFEDSLDLFFKNARKSGSREALRWQQYLEDLAIIINNIHLIYDTDFILGGYLAAYLNQDDVDVLYNHIATMTPFEAYRDYIYISKMPKHGITIGAALIYIKDFLDNKIKDEF